MLSNCPGHKLSRLAQKILAAETETPDGCHPYTVQKYNRLPFFNGAQNLPQEAAASLHLTLRPTRYETLAPFGLIFCYGKSNSSSSFHPQPCALFFIHSIPFIFHPSKKGLRVVYMVLFSSFILTTL